ncbi:MAG: nucleotide pyrophosphohydrolase [Phycisphaerales bacterium]|nr:nucleotide pyrophosphohydrolase [Phycisphaerales bacterium]
MRISEFQSLIRARYDATDRARGASKTFIWFAEEFGELAHAIGQFDKGSGDQANLREEFADCLAWMCTLANICEVDLEGAIQEKYLKDGGPKGVK